MRKYKTNARLAVSCFLKAFEMFDMQMEGVDKMIKGELDRRVLVAKVEGDYHLATEIENITKPPNKKEGAALFFSFFFRV